MRIHGWHSRARLPLAALALGGIMAVPRVADAQEPPAGERRPRIQRESRGEVARDSIAAGDSLARVDSLARADSLRRAAQMPSGLARRDVYFLLAGGVSSPAGDFDLPFDPGWNFTVAFGWQPQRSRWGIRGDIGIDTQTGDEFVTDTFPMVVGDGPTEGFVESIFEVGSATIWSASLDVTLDLVRWRTDRLSAVYLIGGGGVHFFTMPEMAITPTVGPGRGNSGHYAGERQTRFGLHGGAGVAFGVGRAALFVESRYFTAHTDNTNSEWVPLIVGMKWF